MMIISAKVSKQKILTGLLVAVGVIALLVFLFTKSAETPDSVGSSEPSLQAATNEERIAYLQSFGWQVQETPVQTQEVRIPEEFNDVFTRYNNLQQTMGFDLSRYAGKSAKRYVYAVTNHPDGSPDYCATVLVYKNKIIGGDVSSTVKGGVMHGFTMPDPT